MKFRVDDLNGPEIADFIEKHIAEMRSVSPPESKHALDLAGLRKPEITFWTLWNEAYLVGCCALKFLGKAPEFVFAADSIDQLARHIRSLQAS